MIGIFFFASEEALQAAGPAQDRPVPRHDAKLQKSKGDWKSQTIEFNPNNCLPDLADRPRFYRYEGSLTSGDLDERVSWLVFERPVPRSAGRIDPILAVAEQPQRPVDELNRRYVLRSFP